MVSPKRETIAWLAIRQQHWIETDDPLQTSFLVLPPVEFPV
jgi:hypothetical protein